jgi:Fe-S cluster assembly ATP-binding protein
MSGNLVIKNLHVSVDGTPILKGVDLTVNKGEVHALMGPNGSGKSTLSNAIMGHPRYEVIAGDILMDGESILELQADARARQGLFLAFQYPVAIPGVTVANFLRTALNAQRFGGNAAGGVNGGKQAEAITPREFRKLLKDKMALLKIDDSFAGRYLNDGFSGGEKKRVEVMQMAVLRPQIAILDEPDSGLDIDAIKTVSEGVNALRGEDLGILIITHYQRILNYVQPDFVHVMLYGRIARSGGRVLAEELEHQGYDWLKAEVSDALAR